MDLLLEIDPFFYGTYVTTDKNCEKVIILKFLNFIYETMVASLLYHKKFVNTLNMNGFQLNPYDPCVENRIVNDKQQTIWFHVDDCKISHKDSKVNDEFIDTLQDEYKSVFEDGSGKMKVTRGKLHE